MKRTVPFFLLLLALTLCAARGHAASVTLGWDPYIQNPDPDPAYQAVQIIVERCGGNGCTNFVAIPVSITGVIPVTTITYTDSSDIVQTATYYYQLRAMNAAGNVSDPSNIVGVTTPAPQASLFAPTGLVGQGHP